jgi:DegV family protein with EDD domain
LNEVVDRIKEMIPVTCMLQTADTLKYLYMGGRIGRAKHLVGSLLNIKPLISMEDGIVVPVGTARSRRRPYQMMVEKIESVVGQMGTIKVAYVHAAAAEEAKKIKELVEARLTGVESLITDLSPALGVHTGPGTAGLCYYPLRD